MDLQSILSTIQNSQQNLRTATTSQDTIDSDLDNVLRQIYSQSDMAPTLSDVGLPSDDHGRLDRRDIKVWLGQVEANMNENGILQHIKVEALSGTHPRIDNVNLMVHPIPGSSNQSVTDLDFKKIEKEMNELYSGETQDPTDEPQVASGSRDRKIKVDVSEMLNINVIDSSSSDEEIILKKEKAQKKKKGKKLRHGGNNKRKN